jgi:hypothetical protein
VYIISTSPLLTASPPNVPPAYPVSSAVAMAMVVSPLAAAERLGSYEQRLERTMHSALRELRQLRGKDAKA